MKVLVKIRICCGNNNLQSLLKQQIEFWEKTSIICCTNAKVSLSKCPSSNQNMTDTSKTSP